MTCFDQVRDFQGDESRRTGFEWLHHVLTFFAVSEFVLVEGSDLIFLSTSASFWIVCVHVDLNFFPDKVLVRDSLHHARSRSQPYNKTNS